MSLRFGIIRAALLCRLSPTLGPVGPVKFEYRVRNIYKNITYHKIYISIIPQQIPVSFLYRVDTRG